MSQEAENFIQRFIRCKDITKEQALELLIVKIIIQELYNTDKDTLGGIHNDVYI